MFKEILKKMAENFSVVYVLVAIIYATVNVLVYDVKAVEAFLASFLFWCVGFARVLAPVSSTGTDLRQTKLLKV